MLGIRVKDCNSGYRCFTKELMSKIDPQTLQSSGPAIVQEVLFRANIHNANIKEIPITFTDRVKGYSKLSLRDIARGYITVLRLKLAHLMRKPL